MLLKKDKKEQEYLERQGTLWIRGKHKKQAHRRQKFAKHLNKARFPSEVWFETLLLKNNLKKWYQRPSHKAFRWQSNRPVSNYILDFAWPSQRIGVEIDGGSHKDKGRLDQLRDNYLKALGWVILRIDYKDEQKALETIELLKRVKTVVRHNLHRKTNKIEGASPFHTGQHLVNLANNPIILDAAAGKCSSKTEPAPFDKEYVNWIKGYVDDDDVPYYYGES
jgi:very-short-patch-repair endonuclease